MIYRHTQEQVNEYYERGELNQSSLKVLISEGSQAFISKLAQLLTLEDGYMEKEHFIIGGAVDHRLTLGEEAYKSVYHFSELKKKPGDKAMAVLKLAFDLAVQEYPAGTDVDLLAYRKQVYDAANQLGYYSARANKDGDHTLDTRINELVKNNGKEYWADLSLAVGKQILSEDQATTINAIVHSFLTHPFTAYLFQDSEDIDIIYQLPIYFEVDGVPCKGMIDMVIVNHKLKRIFPIDIKTLSDYTLRFNKAIRVRRYDIQASFYSYGLTVNRGALNKIVGKNIDKYQQASFAFLAESTVRPGNPFIFVLSPELMAQGEYGNEEMGGWRSGISKYKALAEAEMSVANLYNGNNGVIILGENDLKTIY